jgi:hypothetical protein
MEEAKWSTKQVLVKKNILDGTIENHQCDPQMACPECKGDRQCVKCHGTGEVRCDNCGGSGNCPDCHGEGYHICNKCGGTGTCRRCGGSGQIICKACGGRGYDSQGKHCSRCHGKGYQKCPDCSTFAGRMINSAGSGTGHCSKCGGSGHLECESCNSTGHCRKCGGSGQLVCHHCGGTGYCPNCNGSGLVTCTRCNGTGWYQTMNVYQATCYAKSWNYVSVDSLKEGLLIASGTTIFNETFKKWESHDKVEYDNTQAIVSEADKIFNKHSVYANFEKAYNKELIKLAITDQPYKKSLNFINIPMSKIVYSINNHEYVMYIIGDNRVVLYDDIPTKVEIFKTSFLQRIRMSLSKRRRILSYMRLAAYIFQCDGKSLNESRVLNVFVNSFSNNPNKVLSVKKELLKYNKEMPYEVLRKRISSLFISKKTISFAWQCIAVDKERTVQEDELFSKIVSEYNVDHDELERLKKFGSKYSLLKDEYIVDEYIKV